MTNWCTKISHRMVLKSQYQSPSPSEQKLRSLIPLFIQAAQGQYDQWDASDPELGDPDVGFGGICQDIAGKIADVISTHTDFDVSTISAQCGEQHVWVIVKTPDGIYEVDIPASCYETGGGYNWQKIPDVQFSSCDIAIGRLSADPNEWNQYTEGSVKNWWTKITHKYAGLQEDIDSAFDPKMFNWDKRVRFTQQYGWSVPTKEAIIKIKEFVGNDRVLEVGAGKGTWAKLMQDAGIQVTPTDLHAGVPYGQETNSPSMVHEENPHWKKQNIEDEGMELDRNTFTPVYQMGAEDAIAKFGDHAVLFLNWPPYNEPMAANSLKAFQGNRVIYVGEGYGGCTGDDCFHEILDNAWQVIEYVCIPRWSGINDCLTLYTRK